MLQRKCVKVCRSLQHRNSVTRFKQVENQSRNHALPKRTRCQCMHGNGNSLVLYCCDRKARAAYAQSFAPWQRATTEITRGDHPIIACLRHMYTVLFFAHIPSVANRAFSATPAIRLQQLPLLFTTNHTHPKAAPGTTFTSWSQHHFVAIGNPERQVRKASHRGSKQQ